MNKEINVTNIISTLSHELKNDFILIRAAAGSIKRNLEQPEVIKNKIETINNTLDQAIKHLEATQGLLLATGSNTFNAT